MKVFFGSNVKKSVINQLLTLITMLLINDISFSLFVLLALCSQGDLQWIAGIKCPRESQ